MKAALLVLMLFLFACANQTGLITKENAITVGFVGPLSGDLASWGEHEQQGIELAVSQINERGGIRGRKVRVAYGDSRCDARQAVTALHSLLDRHDPVAVIGDTCSSATLAIAPLAEERGVPLITPTAGSDEISTAGDYVFRVYAPNSKYGTRAAELLIGEGKFRVAMLQIENAYGTSLAGAFAERFMDLGGRIVFNGTYAPSEDDFHTLLLRAQRSDPDVMFLAGYYLEGILILRQAKELGIDAPFFGGSDTYESEEFLESVGETAEGFVLLSSPTTSGPDGARYAAAFEERYGTAPTVYSDYAHDAAMSLFLAIEEGGTDRAAIKDSLYDLDFAGASNRIRFDANGDLLEPRIVRKEIRNGEFIVR